MKFLTILSHTFRFYKEKIKEIALISFIFLLNFLLIRLFILPTLPLYINSEIFFNYLLLVLLWVILSNSLFELSILHLVKLPKSSLKNIFKDSFLKVFLYLGLKIILGVIIFLGLLLFFIPGIILGIYLAFSLYSFIDQDLSVFQSIKESWRLVRGNWWLIFKMVFLFSLLGIGFSLILWMVLFYVFKNPIFNFTETRNGFLSLPGAITDFFNFLFLTPLNLIFFYHLYFFIKKKKDHLEEVELELTQ